MQTFCKELIDSLRLTLNDTSIENLKLIVKKFDKICIIGNGGSNAIASHISVDYTKWLKIPTFAFTDSSMLTAFINDFGIESGYAEYLKSFVNQKSLVILISSSGNSNNIVNCVKFCENNNISYILLTGFNKNNKCRLEILNNCVMDIWVNSNSYGIVELTHESFLHSIVDN